MRHDESSGTSALSVLVAAWAAASPAEVEAHRQRVWVEVDRLSRIAAARNRDIPEDRRPACASDATDKIMTHLASRHPGIAVQGSGVAFVRLVVRQCWLDCVRADQWIAVGTESGEDDGATGIADLADPREPGPRDPILRRSVHAVLTQMDPEDVAILERVGMDGDRIGELVEEALAVELSVDTALAKRVRARWDKRVQRAMARFGDLWKARDGSGG